MKGPADQAGNRPANGPADQAGNRPAKGPADQAGNRPDNHSDSTRSDDPP
ncbi:hypothetical protein J2S55_004959 [Streptosporangium brasiliense]|uniref:Uncharacterized protein n=1 Tax=Streptosporangium brasiliense TaxID=47480 RepID=A0ABT9R8Z0_9ACTN|nr:hypothetical protein [Streptosporangium brasiliense]